MIRFSISRLEKEPIELAGEEPAEWLELPEDGILRAVSPVSYRLLAQKVAGGGALVDGKAAVKVAGECGRCLEPVEMEVVNDKIHLFYELPDEDELDITEDVRAEIMLELPVNPLCSEDCPGLCPTCGKDLNEGPCNCRPAPPPEDNRWGTLDQLKLK